MGHTVCMEDVRNSHKNLLKIPDGKGSLGKPLHRWKNNIKIRLNTTGCTAMESIRLTSHRAQRVGPRNNGNGRRVTQ